MTKSEAADLFIDRLGKHPKRLMGISVMILAVGFLWHLVAVIIDPESKTIAFPRSGALLVVFAIVTVFFNHLLEKTKDQKKVLAQFIDKPAAALTTAMHQVATPKVEEILGREALDGFIESSPAMREAIESVGEHQDIFEAQLVKKLGQEILQKSLDRNPELLDAAYSEVADDVKVGAADAEQGLRVIAEAEVNCRSPDLT